jgi:UDP-N-acetylglucosamine 2-epimerase
VTLRDETEWLETVEAGWNVLTGVDNREITRAVKEANVPMVQSQMFGDGQAAQQIVEILINYDKK